MPGYHRDGDDLILNVKVQPRSSSDGFAGIFDNHIKIKLTVPPIGGKANQALTKYLAKLFKVPVSRVVIEKGTTSRTKRLRIIQPKFIPDFIVNPPNSEGYVN